MVDRLLRSKVHKPCRCRASDLRSKRSNEIDRFATLDKESCDISPTIVTVVAALAHAKPAIGASGKKGGANTAHQSLNKTNSRCKDSIYTTSNKQRIECH